MIVVRGKPEAVDEDDIDDIVDSDEEIDMLE